MSEYNFRSAYKVLSDLTDKLYKEKPTNRETYLAWVKQWKSAYFQLALIIREAKASRKHYKYEYRAKGDTSSPRRKIVGDNPRYDSEAAYYARSLAGMATNMLDWRSGMKEEAKARSEAARVTRAA